jgi:hypothetical protein
VDNTIEVRPVSTHTPATSLERVIERHAGFLVVEKTGIAGEVAERVQR